VDHILSQGDQRSREYREGVLAVFRMRRLGGCIPHPYEMGTAEADAYFSGVERGHHEWGKILTGAICVGCGRQLAADDVYYQGPDGISICPDCRR
jgi:hypothetical protein